MFTKILVRFGELSTKGKNKMLFINHLVKNIKDLTRAKVITKKHDRIFIEYSKDNMEKLQYIFGIYSYSPVIEVKTDLQIIEKTINDALQSEEGKTFKVITKRNWKGFLKNSNELNNMWGSMILKNFPNLSVDVKNPNIKVEVIIKKDFTYIYFKRVLGLGGLPTGVNGRVLHLMSGGLDSPIAALELMKRGLYVDFLNFVTPPHTDQRTIDKVNNIVKQLTLYQGRATIFRSNYTDLMNLIGLTSMQDYKITLMRRSFYRIATIFAKENGYIAISNGENIGQVASQTLESIHVINNQTSLPVLRPVLTADKLETINKSKKFNLYNLCISECVESCEFFAPKRPVIKPKLKITERLENEISDIFKLEEQNLENIKLEKFRI